MKRPLVLTCFLLLHSSILGAPRTGCKFPEEWNGRWFQSGNPGLVTVNGSIISNKGHCIEVKDDDKFLLYDTKEGCYRCMVMHEKHPNVLQYKETYCTIESPEPSLEIICSYLTSDAILISLFRTGAAPLPCPIKGPLEFTYSQGDGECNWPLSRAEVCTQESRLLLRYQACANVRSSESVDVQLECLATWREGSTNYMVARLYGDRKTNDEESYRCFIYTRGSNNTWHMAQSGDATCTGLLSITEAAKTFKMKQKYMTERCAYPSWVVAPKSWVALDRMASRLLASTYNLTILDRNETRLACHATVPIEDHHHHYSSATHTYDQMMFVAKATRDCKNGYVCIMFHKRDEHVIEMQLSKWSQQPDDVCNSSTFNSHSTPFTTFITSDPMTRQCPYLGHYEIVSVMYWHSADNVEDTVGVDGEVSIANVVEVKDVRVTSTPFPRRCHHERVRWLDIGCRTPDRMEFATSCSDEALSEYLCHGTWIENDTAYLVASTDVGRYCLVYSASAATTGDRELSVTGHLASCPRASHRHPVSWQVNLTSYVQCGDISSASSWRSHVSSTVLLIVLSGILFGRYIARS
ncbi:uncharacterized protein LOC124950759 [Vespa velutina]|uniref:uncharacterized protein LOC124950759 n=2 Tax=Vespa TaxID=7443 RepID=UPI001FB306A2|nr:uncharacterized protein LOC124950759 [Vespa velutina]XP_047353948.1 uncharacterized protein LOC124950759 [Vespa velutina]XP_047353949.1 uncharacterized protein LOC124950759 [Vespa velutina]XP_047353951.1 uncharacterized protein LOC124950759 [Vespa velutina]